MSTFVTANEHLNKLRETIELFHASINAQGDIVLVGGPHGPTVEAAFPVLSYLHDQTALTKMCLKANADDIRKLKADVVKIAELARQSYIHNEPRMDSSREYASMLHDMFARNTASIDKQRKFFCIATLVVLGASLFNLVSVFI